MVALQKFVLELFHETSLTQFTFQTYVIIYADYMGFSLVSGILITLVLFFGVHFEEGAVGNSKCCFVNSLLYAGRHRILRNEALTDSR